MAPRTLEWELSASPLAIRTLYKLTVAKQSALQETRIESLGDKIVGLIRSAILVVQLSGMLQCHHRNVRLPEQQILASFEMSELCTAFTI